MDNTFLIDRVAAVRDTALELIEGLCREVERHRATEDILLATITRQADECHRLRVAAGDIAALEE